MQIKNASLIRKIEYFQYDIKNLDQTPKIPKTKRIIRHLVALLDYEQKWFDSVYHVNFAGNIIETFAHICIEYDVSLLNLFRDTEIKQTVKPNPFQQILKLLDDKDANFSVIWQYMMGSLGYILYRYHFSCNSLPIEQTIENLLDQHLGNIK
jgi:hypothetical protein